MLKHFRVPGRLALKLKDLESQFPRVLRRAGLPRGSVRSDAHFRVDQRTLRALARH